MTTDRLHATSAPVTTGRGTTDARLDGQAASPRNNTFDISAFEREVLQRIAKADGEPVPQDTVKRSLGTTNLRLQTGLDHLTALDLVEVLQEVDDQDEVVLLLTSRGRQYVVDKKLA